MVHLKKMAGMWRGITDVACIGLLENPEDMMALLAAARGAKHVFVSHSVGLILEKGNHHHPRYTIKGDEGIYLKRPSEAYTREDGRHVGVFAPEVKLRVTILQNLNT